LLLQKPDQDEWGTGVDVVHTALVLEKSINQTLFDLHTISETQNDAHVCIRTNRITTDMKVETDILASIIWRVRYSRKNHMESPIF
jgi:hypothetical protein